MTWWSDDALDVGQSEAAEPARHVEVAIIGAGFAGIGAAAQLRRSGRESFVVLERAQTLGGTWRDNTYPGVACDIPSHLYSFSFSPNPAWSRVFAPGHEIRDYLERTAAAEGVLDRIVGGAELLDATWDAAADCWRLTTTRGEWSADALVLACGRLVEPALDFSRGADRGEADAAADLGSFSGPIFHTARWRHDVELAGRRVAVVGTGASAVQLVPELAAAGAHVTVFQRSAPWVMPRADRAYSDDELARFRTEPAAIDAVRADAFAAGESMFPQRLGDPAALAGARGRALAHLHAQVADEGLRRILTPDYEIGCKRVLFSDDWYPAIAGGSVDLEPSAFVGVVGGGVDDGRLVAASGRRIDADVLIVATGFQTAEQPYARLVHGTGGRSLAEHWAGGMTSVASTVVSGFPNLFVLNGPNASLGHNSSIVMIEAQLQFVLEALAHLDSRGDRVLEATPQAEAAYTAALDAAASSTVWLTGGCRSWYIDERSGRLTLLWPGSATAFSERGAVFDRATFFPDLVDAGLPSV
jgi:cation diffusion facilitator CzcD-associated flavoprotein CzcO